jgi:hypothetical protein
MAVAEPFFSWARLAREGCVLYFLISYAIMAWLLFSLAPPSEGVIRTDPMGAVAARRGGCGSRPQVHVQCGRTGMYWTVRDGEIVKADEVPAQTVFRVEPVPEIAGQNHSFALRHLETLRLVTVAPPGSAHAFMLKLGPLKVETKFELFTVHSLSIRSNGIGGLINHRDRTSVRAHGNVEPWAPMEVETATTRIIFRETACLQPHIVEDALLRMVDKMHVTSGVALPPPFPGTSKSSQLRPSGRRRDTERESRQFRSRQQ